MRSKPVGGDGGIIPQTFKLIADGAVVEYTKFQK